MSDAGPPARWGAAMGRLLLVLVRPGEAFRSLAKDPRWAAALVATLLVATVSNAVVFQTIGLGNVMRDALGSGPQVEEVVRRTEASLTRQLLLYLAPLPTTAVLVVGVALVFLAAFTILGATGAERQIFAVTTHAFFAYAVATGALTVLVVLLERDPSAVNAQDPLVSSVGDFLDRSQVGPFVHSAASSLDLFSLLLLAYLAGGFRVALPALRPAPVWTMIVGLWAGYVLIKASLSAAFAG